LAEDEPDDVSALRAESEAKAHFAGALADDVGEQTVESGDAEQQGRRGEAFQQMRGEALAAVGVFDDLVHRGDVGVSQRRVGLLQLGAELGNNLRERALRANGEIHGNAFEIDIELVFGSELRQAKLNFRRGRVIDASLAKVVQNADDGCTFARLSALVPHQLFS